MHLRKNLIPLLLFVSILAACTRQPGLPAEQTGAPPAASPTSAATLPPTELPIQGETPASPADAETVETEEAPPPGEMPRTRYTITAVMDYGRHHLAVDERIRYTNSSPDPLPDLLLMVEPVYYPNVFSLKTLAWEDGTEVSQHAWEGSQLRIPLPQSLQPGESLGLALTYELALPSPTPSAEVRPVPFGYTARQANLVDWYPFVPPYIPGEGWLAHKAGYFGEHLAFEAADFEVSIRLADERSDLIVAASAPAELDGDWRRYELDSARNFAWSVSHDYQVMTQTVGTVTVIGYSFPAHAAAGEMALKTTAESLALFNELFGPYPRQSLSVVEADFLDGMEYEGLYFLSNGFYNLYSGQPADYLTAIAAHETAHMWWYGLVGNDQAMEPWLDEALCTYSERLFFEYLYPEALDWWWAYRINYYNPIGPVDGTIYSFGSLPQPYRAYRDAVYLNGAIFMEELRLLTGEEAFFGFLKDYATKYAFQLATADDFFDTLKEHTQTDIQPLLNEFFPSRRK